MDVCPQKAVPKWVRLTISGDQANYPGEVTTQPADLTTVKLHLNSVVSMPHGKFLAIDINFYLDTPLDCPEYACIATKHVPQQFIDEYNLASVIFNGYLYLKVVKGMYGLPQAGTLANKFLKICLAPHGYIECAHMPRLWKHITKQTTFPLWVNDFGTHYTHERCTTPHQNTTTMVQNYNRLDWHQILWSCTQMELWNHKDGLIC